MNGAKIRKRTGSGLHAHVVDILGQAIVNGDMEPGSIAYADQLCEQLGVSRSVVREAIRTLSSMGLVESRPQVGTRVLSADHWELLNPSVVRWRGQGPGSVEQMKQLLELRLGVEHVAAGLAAVRLSEADARKILDDALAMRAAMHEEDPRWFFEKDASFHRRLLEGTKNAVIAQLADTIATTLDVRGEDMRPGMRVLREDSVETHIQLAQALVDRDPVRAQSLALEMIQMTLDEFDSSRLSQA